MANRNDSIEGEITAQVAEDLTNLKLILCAQKVVCIVFVGKKSKKLLQPLG